MTGKTRIRLAGLPLVALAAAACIALASPGTASAHYVDAYHQHGWSYVAAGQITQCFDNSWAGQPSSVAMYWPDVVTTPVGDKLSQQVHLIAELQYFDFRSTAWTSVTDRYGNVVYSPWYYMNANTRGPVVQWWFEYGTNRYAPNRLGFDVVHGYYYRIKVWYHWAIDNSWHSDETNYCFA
jgi:hypothetical protein